jgi:hypothetical protein
MKKVKILTSGGMVWIVDTNEKLESAYLALFQHFDFQGMYKDIGGSAGSTPFMVEALKRARNGDYFAARDILAIRKHHEYEDYTITEAVDPCAVDYGALPFVQTVACVEHISFPLGATEVEPWKRIWSSRSEGWGNVEMWVATPDLKDDFVHDAKKAFGDKLMQVVRLGAYPQVEYQRVE